METKLIECKLIDVPRVGGDVRTFSKEFAARLAESFRIDGLLSPIVVRPNPKSPGRSILVAGRHRLYGMKNVLRKQFIRATIIKDMSDDEAALAADVENLWRNPLNPAQHAAAVKRWHTHWLSKMSVIEPKAADARARPEPVDSDQSDQKAIEARVAAAVENAASEAEFDETVAAVTGKSPVTIRRSKAIGNAFTEKQLGIFARVPVNQTDMLTIAKIKDESQRAEVVNLIASGMVVADAIGKVMKDKAPARYNNGGAHADAARAAAKQEKAPALTDDEWFEANCGEKAAMLGDPAHYRSDALLFRAVSGLRHTFRSKGSKFLVDTEGAGNPGAFFSLVSRFVCVAHPKDWPICIKCKGTGKDARAARCGNCQGGGYLVTSKCNNPVTSHAGDSMEGEVPKHADWFERFDLILHPVEAAVVAALRKARYVPARFSPRSLL